jgi:uridine kinase
MYTYAVETWEKQSEQLASHPRKQSTLLIAIDGPGGSGKSTLARSIAEHRADSTILQMDDFFFPSQMRASAKGDTSELGGDLDWRRMRDQVLTPLSRDKPGRYQRYDWGTDKLEEWHDLPVGGAIIVEGVYSLRHELGDFYDFGIWVNCPKEVYLARGLERALIEWPERSIEESRAIWENVWIPAEERYAREHHPERVADLVIDTSGRVPVDPTVRFVRETAP